MGINSHCSASSLGHTPPPPVPSIVYRDPPSDPRNPDPSRWKPLRHIVVDGYLVLEARYPNCTNYEGKKIMLFDKGVTVQDLFEQQLLDPHFCNEGHYIHPIARFEPTDRGWTMGIKLALDLSK
jgi:hypothetical protein